MPFSSTNFYSSARVTEIQDITHDTFETRVDSGEYRDIDIYKAELDGTVVGKFGHAGKLAPGFQVVHMMDCRNPNEIIAGEIESWRMQKFVLKGSK